MYLDAQQLFSDAQAETTASAHDSTNYIDLQFDGNLGVGEPMAVVIVLDAG